jgi:hypothetical protein
MNLFKMFQTDAQLEKDGVYIEYGNNEKGHPTRFLIARAGGANTHFQSASEHETKPYRRMMQNDMLTPEIANKILMNVYSKAVVKNWEGVLDEDGNDFPFSQSNVIILFTKLPDLFKDIQAMAAQGSNFRLLALEEEAKN